MTDYGMLIAEHEEKNEVANIMIDAMLEMEKITHKLSNVDVCQINMETAQAIKRSATIFKLAIEERLRKEVSDG